MEILCQSKRGFCNIQHVSESQQLLWCAFLKKKFQFHSGIVVPHRESVCNSCCKMLYSVVSPHRWALHGHRELSSSTSCTFTASYWWGPVGSLANLPPPAILTGPNWSASSQPLLCFVVITYKPWPRAFNPCPSSSLSHRQNTFTLLLRWHLSCRRGWAALTWAGPMRSGLLPDSDECVLVGEHDITLCCDCPCLCTSWPKHWSTKHRFDATQHILSFICISSYC